MKSYKIEPRFKKSVEEIEHWRNPETEQTLAVEVLWRTGEYIIHPQNEEEEQEILRFANMNEDEAAEEGFVITAFEEWELISTWDGCYEEVHFHWDLEDDEREELSEQYWEENTQMFYDMGFDSYDCDITIYNGITIEEWEGWENQ